MNKFLHECNRWTETELKLRQDIIVNEAMNLWSYPKTDYVPEVNPENIHSLYEDFDYTNYNIRTYKLMGTSYKVNDWTDTVIDVIKALYDLDKDSIENAANSNENSLIVNTKITYGRITQIADNVYINKNTNTNAKIKLMKFLFDECELDQNELQFDIYLSKEEDIKKAQDNNQSLFSFKNDSCMS